jgi:polyisoprenyl-phosphate glycosyltransferase
MTSMELPEVNIVVPLYNEEAVFHNLSERLIKLLDSTPISVEVIMVDDGSADRTAQLMAELSHKDRRFQSVFLSRNFGHQLALSAGLKFVNAREAVFIIDGDLQDPPELLDEFYRHYKTGNDVVYAVRKKRKEGLAKRIAYRIYYRILKRVANMNIPLDSGDFSLVSRRVINIMNTMPEESRYLRGMRSWIGFRQIGVEYERAERSAGDSKYSWKQLFSLAKNGIFNFSEYPIKVTFMLGIIALLSALVFFGYTLFCRLVLVEVPEGFTSLLFTIIMFSGVQLIALGLIGEYVIRIFFQVKDRPLFIVKERISNGEHIYE